LGSTGRRHPGAWHHEQPELVQSSQRPECLDGTRTPDEVDVVAGVHGADAFQQASGVAVDGDVIWGPSGRCKPRTNTSSPGHGYRSAPSAGSNVARPMTTAARPCWESAKP
jgi:hypothetical protein